MVNPAVVAPTEQAALMKLVDDYDPESTCEKCHALFAHCMFGFPVQS